MKWDEKERDVLLKGDCVLEYSSSLPSQTDVVGHQVKSGVGGNNIVVGFWNNFDKHSTNM